MDLFFYSYVNTMLILFTMAFVKILVSDKVSLLSFVLTFLEQVIGKFFHMNPGIILNFWNSHGNYIKL